MKQFLPFVLLALLASGCCSYRRGSSHGHHGDDYHHASTQPVPGHGATTPLPPPYNPPPNPPVVVAPPPVVSQLPANQSTNITVGDGETILHLKTQDFSVDKVSTSAGVARIRKWIVAETKSVPVTVCHDDVVFERTPASGPSNDPFWTGDGYVEIPLTKEVVTPVTRTRVYETLKVRKVQICETNSVGAIVRTEKAEVVR